MGIGRKLCLELKGVWSLMHNNTGNRDYTSNAVS